MSPDYAGAAAAVSTTPFGIGGQSIDAQAIAIPR